MQLGRHRAFNRGLIKEARWIGNAGDNISPRGGRNLSYLAKTDMNFRRVGVNAKWRWHVAVGTRAYTLHVMKEILESGAWCC